MYIRTKEGVYDLDKYLIENATKKCFRGVITGVDSKEDIEIIKQADTIEELCDEYVIKYKYKDKPETIRCLNNELRLIRRYILSIIKDIEFVKLAIWTEWGLKYVAKMNEKGELELL